MRDWRLRLEKWVRVWDRLEEFARFRPETRDSVRILLGD
jgi:hypothetical protein